MSNIEKEYPKTLQEVLNDLWCAKKFMLTGMIVGVICAGIFIFSAVPHYKAQMIVSPANPMNGAEVSSLLADDNLFALRYLAQRVGVSSSSDFVRFETTYSGASVAALLLKDTAIVSGLSQDKSFLFSKKDKDWNAARLSEYIEKNVRMNNVGTSSMRYMSYNHSSPEFAAYFLHHIHRTTDELIRVKIRKAAAKRILYLEDMITNTMNPEHRRALTTLLLEQERLQMLVSIETPYAAIVIEPAFVFQKAVWPNVMFVFVTFLFVGIILGFAIYNLTAGIFKEKNAAPFTSEKQKRWYKSDNHNSNEKILDEKDIIEAAK